MPELDAKSLGELGVTVAEEGKTDEKAGNGAKKSKKK